MQSWQLIPFIGIQSHMGQLMLGMSIEEVEKTIGKYLTDNVGETGCSLRNYYEYEIGSKLDAIEFFNGSLRFEDLEICRTDIKLLKESFLRKRFSLSHSGDSGLGQFCPQLGIYILSNGDCGGETDNVECVIICSPESKVPYA